VSEEPVTEAELQAHVDGHLLPAREPVVLAWLAAHPEEARRIAAYRAQADALRQALEGIGDEPVPAALDLRLQLQHRGRRAGLRPAAAAACAAGLLLAGGAGGWALRGKALPPQTGTAALAREAASSYAVYANDATRPVELAAAERGALDSWFSRRLARPIRAPNLQAAGLTLIGGRLVATEHGAAALYLYQDRVGRRLVVYLRPMQVERTDHMQLRRDGAIGGWTWADDGLGFGVFGTAPVDRLHGAANIVRSQLKSV
jgi:anti-sigma factor RsiW